MNTFISKFVENIKGILVGFDRVVLQGNIRNMLYNKGLEKYFFKKGVYKKDFKEHCKATTNAVRKSVEGVVESQGRPVKYLPSSNVRKDELALQIAANDKITSGSIVCFKTLELCTKPIVRCDQATGHLVFRIEKGKCLHLYNYFIDDTFGFMSARVQSWYPFNIQICLNGHEYLARQMDKHNIAYVRNRNCFTDISDIDKAQELYDQMKTIDWVKEATRIRQFVNPIHDKIITNPDYSYYWTAYQTEWSQDILFNSEEELNRIYPQLTRGSIMAFTPQDVMRFLGRKNMKQIPNGDVKSSYASPYNGVRVKFTSQGNSVKAYNKAGSVLRIETTINNVTPLKSFHRSEKNTDSEPQWRQMRKSVDDMPRRIEISQTSNERLTEALATIDTTEEIGVTFAPVCKPVKCNGKQYRGLKPFSEDDVKLLNIISVAGFNLEGFANKDIAAKLFGEVTDKTERARNSSKVSYRLRILKSHGLIRKKRNERKYNLTADGRKFITQLLQLQHTSIEQLISNTA
jgi:hypothetical protein